MDKLTDIERAVIKAAQRIINQDTYPSVPRIWELLGKHRGPSVALVDSTRKALLARQLFPLAGGRSVSASQAQARRREKIARGEAPAPRPRGGHHKRPGSRAG